MRSSTESSFVRVLARVEAISICLSRHSAGVLLKGLLVLWDWLGCTAQEGAVAAVFDETGLHLQNRAACRIVGNYPVQWTGKVSVCTCDGVIT